MIENGGFKIWYAFSLAWQLGFIIAFSIAGFMFLGFLGDEYLGTAPYLLVMGIFLGMVVTVYEVHNLVFPLIHKKHK